MLFFRPVRTMGNLQARAMSHLTVYHPNRYDLRLKTLTQKELNTYLIAPTISPTTVFKNEGPFHCQNWPLLVQVTNGTQEANQYYIYGNHDKLVPLDAAFISKLGIDFTKTKLKTPLSNAVCEHITAKGGHTHQFDSMFHKFTPFIMMSESAPLVGRMLAYLMVASALLGFEIYLDKKLSNIVDQPNNGDNEQSVPSFK